MKVQVDEDFAGQRIDKFLAAIERIGSRARAEKLLEAGLVTIDGRPAIKSNRVQVGYVIEDFDTYPYIAVPSRDALFNLPGLRGLFRGVKGDVQIFRARKPG